MSSLASHQLYARFKTTPLLDYLYWSLVALCVADWSLTIVGLLLGAHEVNPLFIRLGEFLGIYTAISIGKILQIAIFTGLWRFAKNQQEVTEWRVSFGLVLILYCWVVVHNFSVIRG